MNKICTDVEQSKKLVELGIDANTADMHYFIADSLNQQEINYAIRIGTLIVKTDIPAWSLTALLGLIPPGNILLRDALSGKYKCIYTVDSDYYDNSVDAAFEMVCWLLENKKI